MANDILGFISIFPQGEDDALPGGADLGTGWNVGTAGQGDGGQCPAQGFWRWQVSLQLHTTFSFSVQIWKKTMQVSNYLLNSKSALPIHLDISLYAAVLWHRSMGHFVFTNTFILVYIYIFMFYISLYYVYADIRIPIFTSVWTCRWQPDLHWWWSYGWLLPILLGTKPMWSVQLVWMLWWTPLHIFHHRGQIFFMVSGMKNRPWERFGSLLGGSGRNLFLSDCAGAACNNSWIEIYENHWFVKQQLMLPEAIAAIITSFSHVFL